MGTSISFSWCPFLTAWPGRRGRCDTLRIPRLVFDGSGEVEVPWLVKYSIVEAESG